jgi:hypothetical protein
MELSAFCMTHSLNVSHVSGIPNHLLGNKFMPEQEQRQGYVGGFL